MDVITGDLKDLASCSAMSLSRSGSLALIAGKRVFGLIDLDRPDEIASKVIRRTKYDINEVQFNYEKETLCAVASNDKVELIDWRQGAEVVCQGNLKAHSRTVTDISWHWQKTKLLATCSLDHFVHIWDITTHRNPVTTLSAVTGTTQVCWERLSGHVLATAHEGEIRLWDLRKSKDPFLYINGHLSKIYSIDFSPVHADQLVSTSADNSVKVWDTSNLKNPEKIVKVPRTPVWRVRYTPFGEGLVTLIVTNVARRENNLILWNATNLTPVHTFYGHSDMVLEFGWRNPDLSRNRADYQLVTWSKDCMLKLWPIGGNLKVMCGVDDDPPPHQFVPEDAEEAEDDDVTRRSEADPLPVDPMPAPPEDQGPAPPSTPPPPLPGAMTFQVAAAASAKKQASSDSLDQMSLMDEAFADTPAEEWPSDESRPGSSTQPANLKQEFSLINFGDKFMLETLDLNERYCIIVAETTKHFIYLNVKFPLKYPVREPPVFTLMTGTTLEQNKGYELLKKMRVTAQQQVARNRRCLEMCLRQFEQDINALQRQEQEELSSAGQAALGGFQHTNVPFPRSSGARFCGTGQLVCFGWAYTVKVASATSEVSNGRAMKTPRALSAVSTNHISGNTPPQYMQCHTVAASVRRSSSMRFKSRITSTSTPSDKKGAAHQHVQCSDCPHRTLSDPATGATIVAASKLHEDVARHNENTAPAKVCQNGARGTVTIYDVLCLWPFSKYLALRCTLVGGDPKVICQNNATVAMSAGCRGAARAWRLASSCCEFRPKSEGVGSKQQVCHSYEQGMLSCSCGPSAPHSSSSAQADEAQCSEQDDSRPWSVHPMGRPLLEALIDHYGQWDVQTTAMLCCVFSSGGSKCSMLDDQAARRNREASLAQSHIKLMSAAAAATVSGRKKCSKSECSQHDGLDLDVEAVLLRSSKRAIPESHSLEDLHTNSALMLMLMMQGGGEEQPRQTSDTPHAKLSGADCPNHLHLDPRQSAKYDHYMSFYAEILSRLGYHLKSAEVRKCLSDRYSAPDSQQPQHVSIMMRCPNCGNSVYSQACEFCMRARPVVTCVLCNLPARGLTSVCIKCGHGGHTLHMKAWFENHSVCAQGCGCRCTVHA